MEAEIEPKVQHRAILFAILAAALYAISSPVSKLLLKEVPPTFMASFLYLGAGIGMALVGLVRTVNGIESGEKRLTTKEIPYTVGMIVLDIAAPIFLMIGLTTATPENVSLLNNFEIVATSLIALFIFKERITKRLWSAIILITLASMILSMENTNSFSFSIGSIFVLLACTCWGLENNFTRKLSIKDPLQVVVIKGFGSGTGSLLIALAIHERVSNWLYIFAALLLGFLAYGMSIFFYIYAQRYLGAAKTSAYYAIAPFIGAGLSLLIFRDVPTLTFLVALVIMIVGTYLASIDGKE
ncbi:MAG TPA: DMT family transporter [Fervidobacterium sp.]|nr:DMT family transporter [Fervidobacterium sp.]MBP8657256.1 DMT family transporter [Fervidobacterium sp.]HOL03857.1 DMT family transporter [Fervidobacterium sp.]HUM76438.1 DMT family transporter [Fervidobacterium sp.]